MRSVWKIPVFFTKNTSKKKFCPVYHRNKLISSRSTGTIVAIYVGKKDPLLVSVKPSMVGYPFSSFSYTKKSGSNIHIKNKKTLSKRRRK